MADSPHIREARGDSFETLVLEESKRLPVLVDFWAAWCAPCQVLMPILAKLASDYRGKFLLAKVNTDEEQELARRYSVRSLPTVLLIKNGSVVEQFMGAQPEHVIKQLLDRHIPRESDHLRAAAADALERGELPKARRLLEHACQVDPQNPGATADLARILISEERYDDAEEVLQRLPRESRDGPEVRGVLGLLSFARTAQAAPALAQLESQFKRSPDDHHLRYRLSARRMLAGDYEGALDLLLELLRGEPSEREQAREAMLAAFDVVGGKGDLVSRYRTRMFNALH